MSASHSIDFAVKAANKAKTKYGHNPKDKLVVFKISLNKPKRNQQAWLGDISIYNDG